MLAAVTETSEGAGGPRGAGRGGAGRSYRASGTASSRPLRTCLGPRCHRGGARRDAADRASSTLPRPVPSKRVTEKQSDCTCSRIAQHWAAAVASGERTKRPRRGSSGPRTFAMTQLGFDEASRLYEEALTVGGTVIDATVRCRLLLHTAEAMNHAGALGDCHRCRMAAVTAARPGRSVSRSWPTQPSSWTLSASPGSTSPLGGCARRCWRQSVLSRGTAPGAADGAFRRDVHLPPGRRSRRPGEHGGGRRCGGVGGRRPYVAALRARWSSSRIPTGWIGRRSGSGTVDRGAGRAAVKPMSSCGVRSVASTRS